MKKIIAITAFAFSSLLFVNCTTETPVAGVDTQNDNTKAVFVNEVSNGRVKCNLLLKKLENGKLSCPETGGSCCPKIFVTADRIDAVTTLDSHISAGTLDAYLEEDNSAGGLFDFNAAQLEVLLSGDATLKKLDLPETDAQYAIVSSTTGEGI